MRSSAPAARKKTTRKNKIYKCHNLKIECFIDNDWHAATVKSGQISSFLPGFTCLLSRPPSPSVPPAARLI